MRENTLITDIRAASRESNGSRGPALVMRCGGADAPQGFPDGSGHAPDLKADADKVRKNAPDVMRSANDVRNAGNDVRIIVYDVMSDVLHVIKNDYHVIYDILEVIKRASDVIGINYDIRNDDNDVINDVPETGIPHHGTRKRPTGRMHTSEPIFPGIPGLLAFAIPPNLQRHHRRHKAARGTPKGLTTSQRCRPR